MRIVTPIDAGIQRGASTQSQDQSIKLVSFRTINAMANRPQKPMPPDEAFEFELIVVSVWDYFKIRMRSESNQPQRTFVCFNSFR